MASLYEGSLEIMLTVPLIQLHLMFSPGSTWINVNGKTTVPYIMDRSVNQDTKVSHINNTCLKL